MSTDVILLERRAALKRDVLANRGKILPTLILNTIDQAIRKVIHRKTPLPWVYSAIVLALISILPTLLARVLLKEAATWKELMVAESTAIELAVTGLVVLHFVISFIIRSTNGLFVEAIESIDDLNDLQKWLEDGWTLQNPYKLVVGGAIAWTLISTIWLSISYHMFVGVGFIIAAIFVGGVLGIGLYYLVWAIKLPLHLGNYRYKLHEVDPVHSEVISHLTHTLNRVIYGVAAYFALVTMIDVLIGGSPGQVVVLILVLGWGIITIQFIVNQSTLAKIVSTAKWKTLNEIQAEIRVLRTNGKLTEKETMDAINRLMDLHERVRNTQSSPLDLKAGLTFLNQLMLPLFGFLLANIENIVNFIVSFGN